MYFLQCIFLTLYIIIESKAQLYDQKDNVTIFDQKLFESTFIDMPKYNWFIQFYNPYCGHCINFAPIFKAFIQEAKYWNWVINFGVVDCNAEGKLCNSEGVQYYPYFKVFRNVLPENSSSNSFILKFRHDSLDELYKNSIIFLETYFDPAPLHSFENLSSSMKPPYLLVTGGNSVDLKRTVLTYYNRLKYRLYYQFIANVKDYKLRIVHPNSLDSMKFSNLPELYTGLNNYLIHNASVYDIIHINLPISTMSSIKKKYQFSTMYPVYNQDMYASIIYAFLNDVNDLKLATVENINVLKNFILQLYQFSGFGDNLLSSFREIIILLREKIDSIKTRTKFHKSWTTIMEIAKFPSLEYQWVGCNGSQPHFRRYPCGMWTTFHILSINQYLKSQTNQAIRDSSIHLIGAIREFIITFFSCNECAENFEKETHDYQKEVTNAKSAVLYIWKVHNHVNKRLARKPSEDPSFPKIAFPSVSICPHCRMLSNLTWPNSTQWNQDSVFDYLVHHYSNINVIHFQTRASLLINNSTWLSINLSPVEISLCVVLSVFSSFVVLVAFLKYLRESFSSRRRKYRKSVV